MLQSALNAEHPVAFFINGHGDSYINLPAVRALSRLYDGRLTFICREGGDLFCFEGLTVKNRVVLKAWVGSQGWEFDPVAAAEKIGHCDLFISLVPWYSPQLSGLIETLKPSQTVGFFENYTHCLKLDYGKHSADLAFDIVRALQPDCQLQNFVAPLRYSESQLECVRQIQDLLQPGTKTLTVHLDTQPHKMWSDARWRETLEAFLETHPEFVALLVGGTKHGNQQSVDTGRHADRVIPCYGLPLASSCCLVAKSDFFVGIDSCMLHVADLARVPGVGLFGPTNAREFGFRFGPHIMIQADGSMDGISPRQVISALNRLVSAPEQAVLWQAEWNRAVTLSGDKAET